MKKKIVSVLLAAVSTFGMISSVSAEDKSPKVVVNGCEVICPEQGPVIKEGYTLVPARYVFQVLEASVRWLPEKQQVIIDSKDNTKRIFLTIGSDIMEVVTFTTVIQSTLKEVKLEEPAQIINDRTLIPLRAVSEALGADVSWDGETYTASVDLMKDDEERLYVSLETEAADVSKDEEFSVYFTVDNLDLYPTYGNGGMSVGIKYDKSKFEFVSANLVDSEGNESSTLGADNDQFTEDSLKTIYIAVPPHDVKGKKQRFGVIKFKALSDEGGSLALSSTYREIGFDTSVVLSEMGKDDFKTIDISNPNKLYVDQTPIVLK